MSNMMKTNSTDDDGNISLPFCLFLTDNEENFVRIDNSIMLLTIDIVVSG